MSKSDQRTSRWWFHFFIFTPIWGNDPFWRAYFSTGLVQPPTRNASASWSDFALERGITNIYMGVSLNGGTPKTPQNDHF